MYLKWGTGCVFKLVKKTLSFFTKSSFWQKLQFYRALGQRVFRMYRLICSISKHPKISLKCIQNVTVWFYNNIPFRFIILTTYLDNTFQSFIILHMANNDWWGFNNPSVRVFHTIDSFRNENDVSTFVSLVQTFTRALHYEWQYGGDYMAGMSQHPRGPYLRNLWLLVGIPSALWPELAYRLGGS